MKKVSIIVGALVLMLGSVTLVWAQRGPGFGGRPTGPGFNGTATGPGFNGTARGPGFGGTRTGPGFNGNPNAFPVERNQPGIGFESNQFDDESLGFGSDPALRPDTGF